MESGKYRIHKKGFGCQEALGQTLLETEMQCTVSIFILLSDKFAMIGLFLRDKC